MPKISVIMPSLNVAQYIGACLESVVSQTYRDLEILMIDAGSTDGTIDVIQGYAEKDSRIKLIHSDKKSYGYQVNLGLDAMSGDYVGFADTDDVLVPDAYEVLYRTLDKNRLDYVKGYAKAFWEAGDGRRVESNIADFFVADGTQNQLIQPCSMPELIVKDHFLWLGLYGAELVRHIRLNETTGAAFQDQGFCLQVFQAAHRAMYIDKAVYLYRQDNSNSSTYSHRGLNYVRNEYSLNLRFLKGKDVRWYSDFYAGFWDRCMGRFWVMGVSGEFWEDAEEDIEVLREMALQAVERGYLCEESLNSEKWHCLQLFLRNPRELYEYNRENYTRAMAPAVMLLDKLRGREAVIAGCGKWGNFLHFLLDYRSVSVKAYCDNNSGLWGRIQNGMKVLSMEDAAAKYRDAAFVIASKGHFEAIREQLRRLGIPEDNIVEYTLGVDVGLLR